jgi:hypothetical protein
MQSCDDLMGGSYQANIAVFGALKVTGVPRLNRERERIHLKGQTHLASESRCLIVRAGFIASLASNGTDV